MKCDEDGCREDYDVIPRMTLARSRSMFVRHASQVRPWGTLLAQLERNSCSGYVRLELTASIRRTLKCVSPLFFCALDSHAYAPVKSRRNMCQLQYEHCENQAGPMGFSVVPNNTTTKGERDIATSVGCARLPRCLGFATSKGSIPLHPSSPEWCAG